MQCLKSNIDFFEFILMGYQFTGTQYSLLCFTDGFTEAFDVHPWISFMCINYINAFPVPLLHGDIPQDVLMVTSNNHTSVFSNDFGGKVERLLGSRCLNHHRDSVRGKLFDYTGSFPNFTKPDRVFSSR